MKSDRVRRQWEGYRERVVPADAPPVQVQESQRAFYAGAWALFQTLILGVSDGPNVEPQDEAFMEALETELRTFAADVEAGRA
jgi:hypothetical protein